LGLRIRERIENEYGDVKEEEGLGGWGGERKKTVGSGVYKGKGKAMLAQEEAGVDLEPHQEAGGFMRGDEPEVRREPTSLRSFAKGNDAGVFPLESNAGVESGGFLLEDTDGSGGAFMPDETGTASDGGGGFTPEEMTEDDQSMLSADPDIDNEDLDWF